MADKISAASDGAAIGAGSVTTSGSISAGAVTIAFDDATPQDTIISCIDKAKAQVAAYYLKR